MPVDANVKWSRGDGVFLLTVDTEPLRADEVTVTRRNETLVVTGIREGSPSPLRICHLIPLPSALSHLSFRRLPSDHSNSLRLCFRNQSLHGPHDLSEASKMAQNEL